MHMPSAAIKIKQKQSL